VEYFFDGKHIVSDSGDSTICVCDTETGEMVSGPLKEHNNEVNAVACSPDDKYIVSGSSNEGLAIYMAIRHKCIDQNYSSSPST